MINLLNEILNTFWTVLKPNLIFLLCVSLLMGFYILLKNITGENRLVSAVFLGVVLVGFISVSVHVIFLLF